MSLICPHCGGAIFVSGDATPNAISAQPPGAITDANGAISSAQRNIAQMSLGSTKDGRQAYNQDYPEVFQVFWTIYPLHRDKRKALKAWRNAIRRGAIEDINAGAIRYRDDPNRLAQFTKYAEGWLNADGWLDDPLPVRRPSGETAVDRRMRRVMEGVNDANEPGGDMRRQAAGELPRVAGR